MANHETDESTNSIEDDWKYLDQAIRKESELTEDKGVNDQEIPVESALDEVDAYVDDSYNDILNDKINQSSYETAITAVNGGDVMDEIEVDMRENVINYEGELQSDLDDSKADLTADILEGELDQMDVLGSIFNEEGADLDEMLAQMQEESQYAESIPTPVEEVPAEEAENKVEEVVPDASLTELEEKLLADFSDEGVEESVEEPVEDIELPDDLEEVMEEDLSDELLEEVPEELPSELLQEAEEELVKEDLTEDILEEGLEEVLEETVEETSSDDLNEPEPASEGVVEALDDSIHEDLLKEIEDILPQEFLDQAEEERSEDDMMQEVEPSDEPVMSLEEFDALLGGASLEEPELLNTPKSSSDVFSDSLSAISSLEDQELEDTFNSLLPDMEETQEQEPPKTLMQKMFANIEPENPEEEIKAAKEAHEKKEEEKKLKAEEKEKKKEEKKKAAEEKKVAKAAEKEAKAKAKAEKKAELLAKKQKEKEEFEKNYVPEGKINKIGASIVVGTAAVIGTGIIYGSFKSSNGLTLDSAKFNSQIGRYKQAYEELNGLELSGSDKELYDKVSTVMVVKKQQNSYENFTALNMHVEALDSLLKGLERYDEHYEKAKEYGVTDQYDKLKSKFLTELYTSYGVTAEEAKALILEKDATAYTKSLTEICKDATTK